MKCLLCSVVADQYF